jgi:short-subunit dehydrogenase
MQDMTRTALITGAAHGIGRQLAIHLAKDGYAIAAVDLDDAALRTLPADLGNAPHATAVADVTNADQLQQAARELEAKLGPTMLLVANAGIGFESSAYDFRAGEFEKVIRVNLLGVVNSIAAVLPGMIERRAGHLVALSSLASYRGLPRMLSYSTSKAAVNTLLEGLRTELRPAGIDVTTICPGWIRTKLTERVQHKLPDILELDDALREILWAIRTKRPFHAFPARTRRQLSLLRWLPRSWQDRLLAKMMRPIAPESTQPPPS